MTHSDMSNHNQEIFNSMPDHDDYVGTWRDVLGAARKVGLIPDSTMERDGGFESMVKLNPQESSDDVMHVIKIMLAMIIQARQQHTRRESNLHSNTAGLLRGIAAMAPDDIADVLRQQANTIDALSAHSLSCADALKQALHEMAADNKKEFNAQINKSVEAKDAFVESCERAVKYCEEQTEDESNDE